MGGRCCMLGKFGISDFLCACCLLRLSSQCALLPRRISDAIGWCCWQPSATGLLRACCVWLSVPDYSPSGRALLHLAAVQVLRLHLRHPAGSGWVRLGGLLIPGVNRSSRHGGQSHAWAGSPAIAVVFCFRRSAGWLSGLRKVRNCERAVAFRPGRRFRRRWGKFKQA